MTVYDYRKISGYVHILGFPKREVSPIVSLPRDLIIELRKERHINKYLDTVYEIFSHNKELKITRT